MNSALQKQITVMFSPLNNVSAASAFPAIGALSDLLTASCAPFTQQTVAAKPNDLKVFATASVEMWLRAVHSFLISTSLTEASPIWSSVAGYYSSHYSVRAFAHLFGLFHLHKKRRLIQLAPQGKGWVFHIDKKNVAIANTNCTGGTFTSTPSSRVILSSISTVKTLPNLTVLTAIEQTMRIM